MKIELDVPKRMETQLQNFLRETKYLVFLAEDGNSKVVVLGE